VIDAIGQCASRARVSETEMRRRLGTRFEAPFETHCKIETQDTKRTPIGTRLQKNIAFMKLMVYLVHPSYPFAAILKITSSQIDRTLNAQSIEVLIGMRGIEVPRYNVAIASQENGSGCLPSSLVLPQCEMPPNSTRRGSPRRLNSLCPSGQVFFQPSRSANMATKKKAKKAAKKKKK
jgi:hypothetical protein